MKLLFTPSARAQFLSVLSYIGRDDPPAAVAFRRKAEKILSRLVKYPRSGRPIPEFPELSFREVLVAPYRFFYRAKNNVIWIVAVWHGAQIPPPPEKKKGA